MEKTIILGFMNL